VKIITVWDWIRTKKLPAIRIGKEYRISEDDLKAFEDERRTTRRDEEEK
jgi:excisionase family DNA binding protein